jgi:hypothetical protein
MAGQCLNLKDADELAWWGERTREPKIEKSTQAAI